jgi:hypothetical protein
MTKNKNQEVQSARSELDWNQETPEEREVHYGWMKLTVINLQSHSYVV